MAHNRDTRAEFADRETFSWFVTAGADRLLDTLADGDHELAEKIAFNLLRQASYVQLDAERRRGRG